MTTDTEDRSTWPRVGKRIRRDELLRLIEENGGPEDLDLRGAIFQGEGPRNEPSRPIDLSPEELAGSAAAYAGEHGGSEPPWRGFYGGISLQGAQLQEADLSDAQLQGARLDAQLQGAMLSGQLQGADLSGAQLQRVDMYDVESLVGAHWGRAFLDYTRIDRRYLGRSIGDEDEAHRHGSGGFDDKLLKAEAYRDASEAYLLLKNNFNQIGRYEGASWAYVKEQQMEKMAYYWELRAWGQWEKVDNGREWRSWGWRAWRARGSLWRWLRNWAYELLTGYGERVYMPVLWGPSLSLRCSPPSMPWRATLPLETSAHCRDSPRTVP